MSNKLDQDLTGKVVIVSKEKFDDPLLEFFCEDGFGCKSFTNGSKIYGYWISDKSKDCISGYDVESVKE